MYTGLNFFLLKQKLTPKDEAILTRLIKENDGTIVDGQDNADRIITCLRSKSRVERNLDNKTCPVVHSDWIQECVQQNKVIEFGVHLVRAADAKRPREKEIIDLSSEDEMPRQLRWEEIKAAYAERCGGEQIKKQTILLGHGTVKLRRTSTSSYITTSQSSAPPSSLETIHSAPENPPASLPIQNSVGCVVKTHSFVASETSDEENDGNDTATEEVAKMGKYECQRRSGWNSLNKELTEAFKFLEHARALYGDEFNSVAYRRAASVIASHPKKIKASAQAKSLRGVGKKTGQIINEFLTTGKISAIDIIKADDQFITMEKFYNIHGVGATTAREWYCKGYRDIKDVEKNEKLSRDQRLGIRYYDDFMKKIPRQEVEAIADQCHDLVKELFPGSLLEVCGSYRRGQLESGDVDIILTHPDRETVASMLVKLVAAARQKGFLVDILSMGSECQVREDDGQYGKPDQALCVWKQPEGDLFRRVDLVVSPYDTYTLAILAWTGSSYFERSIRLYAKKEKQIKVTSHGLYSRIDDRRIPVKSEREAFEVLGLDWLEPHERNC